MNTSGFDQYYDEAVEPGRRERAYAWATAIGLQDVDGLKPSKYLIATAKRHIEGEITQKEARQIVDAYVIRLCGRIMRTPDSVSTRRPFILKSS